MMRSENVKYIDYFTYLRVLISLGDLVFDENSTRIQTARLALANLRHMWCRRDIRLPNKR